MGDECRRSNEYEFETIQQQELALCRDGGDGGLGLGLEFEFWGTRRRFGGVRSPLAVWCQLEALLPQVLWSRTMTGHDRPTGPDRRPGECPAVERVARSGAERWTVPGGMKAVWHG